MNFVWKQALVILGYLIFLKGRLWSARGTREREESLLYFSPFARLRLANISFRPMKAG